MKNRLIYWFQRPAPKWDDPMCDELIAAMRSAMSYNTTEYISTQLGISPVTVHRWITGKARPHKHSLATTWENLNKIQFDKSLIKHTITKSHESTDGCSSNSVSSHDPINVGSGAGSPSRGEDGEKK